MNTENMSASEKEFVWAVRGMGLTRAHKLLTALQREADEQDRRNRERNKRPAQDWEITHDHSA